MDTDILILGGGASGLVAAIAALRRQKTVTILEHKDKPGKKILATGNGKCNFTNTCLTRECYHSDNKEFPMEVLKQFGYKDAIAFFQELGIYPKIRNGYVYPCSEQAASVLDVLLMELAHRKARIVTSVHVVKLEKKDRGFLATAESAGKEEAVRRTAFSGKRVILATGGMSYPKLGSDGSGYTLARSMGHHIRKPVPALIGLTSSDIFFKGVSGVRTQARVLLHIDGKPWKEDTGELQLMEYGISGIPAFQLSRHASKALSEKRKVHIVVDFFPELSMEKTNALLKERGKDTYKTVGEMMIGLLNRKLCQSLLKKAGLDSRKPGKFLSEKEFLRLSECIKKAVFPIEGTNGFSQAQITAGGIDTREVNPATMESRLVKGLYFAGEILDADGICGGYNLQWAWATGILAGRNV